MDKNALRELLERQVQEKLNSGYEVTLYAADVGEPDRLKRSMASGTAQKKDETLDPYNTYIQSVESGTYVPESEDETRQEGYRSRDRKREAKGSLSVVSRSTGAASVLGAKPRARNSDTQEKPKDPRNVRLDDLSLFR